MPESAAAGEHQASRTVASPPAANQSVVLRAASSPGREIDPLAQKGTVGIMRSSNAGEVS